MAGVCGGLWKDDIDLKIASNDLVKKGYKRSEILVTAQKYFPQYIRGCVKAQDRRLRHFSINYMEYATCLETVQDAYGNRTRRTRVSFGCSSYDKEIKNGS